ncbi:alpha/beta fold hydrolase [Colwellia sp. RSH04]|uniref:alpha/beta fold hydrolase n=1 Tax=Colwellia sp. RSH04 TaxID=2305464 RepID=UPI0021750ACD|nr:alpha/beta hydrolase [Colwellia sp. RSH04]
MLKPITFQLPHFTLRGLSFGNPKGKVVLCLHGWLDNAASFMPFLAAVNSTSKQLNNNDLVNKYYICLDWVGHGLSEHRGDDAHYHFLDYVYDLLQLFELTQWKNVHILAHSMGGMIASAFAATFPEKVNSLTLIDTLGFITANAEDTTTQLKKGLLSRLKVNSAHKLKAKSIEDGAEKSVNSNNVFSLETAIRARMQVSDLSFENTKLLIERSLLPVNEGFVWRTDKRLRTVSPYRYTLAQATQLLSDIQVPVLLVYGSQGLKQVSGGMVALSESISHFKSEVLSGGHHVHMEQPDMLTKLLSSFWREQ